MARVNDWVPVGGVHQDGDWIKPGPKEGFEKATRDAPEGFIPAMPFTTKQGRDSGRCSIMLGDSPRTRRQCAGRKVAGRDICPSHLKQEQNAERARAEMVGGDGDSG